MLLTPNINFFPTPPITFQNIKLNKTNMVQTNSYNVSQLFIQEKETRVTPR